LSEFVQTHTVFCKLTGIRTGGGNPDSALGRGGQGRRVRRGKSEKTNVCWRRQGGGGLARVCVWRLAHQHAHTRLHPAPALRSRNGSDKHPMVPRPQGAVSMAFHDAEPRCPWPALALLPRVLPMEHKRRLREPGAREGTVAPPRFCDTARSACPAPHAELQSASADELMFRLNFTSARCLQRASRWLAASICTLP
jgi:hypothetical protein